MASTLKLLYILMTVVLVSGFDPLEKIYNLRLRGAAAVGKLKSAVDRINAKAQEKFYNMKYNLANLKQLMYAKMFPNYSYYQPSYTKYAISNPLAFSYKYQQPYAYTNYYNYPDYGFKYWY